jgi:peptide chain release factor subunit 3
MATNGAPESWDQEDEVSNKMGQLNVGAPAFVPNVNAPTFTPSWLPAESAPAQPEAPAASPVKAEPAPMQVDPPASKPVKAVAEEAGESWEDKADMSSAATTPDDEDNSMEDDSGLKKSSRVKKKPVAQAAKTTDKEHVNVVFIGHVDAGKSTIGGQIMYLTNMVDKRTLEKYEKEAKEINRETWYLSWCMDTNAEERNKGKTVEVRLRYSAEN